MGGSPAPAPTSSTVTNTNIPEYARPYVETMLGATQQQLFNTKQGEPTTTTNADGTTTTTPGTTEITGVKPYVPYSENPADYVAGFSPLQQQAQQGVAGLQLPGEYGAAAGLTGMASMGAMGAGRDYQRMATNPYAVGAYMNPYVQQALQPQLNEIQRQADIQGNQIASQATAAGAFGGTRGALARNEAQRNALMAQQSALGQGYNQAFNQAQQAMQYGAGLGLQGQQAAMQGAGQLANIGQLGLQGQQGILGLQAQTGAQQQQQQQNIINQAVQNYATAQQYPQQQLAFMNSMLRGLPLQTMTTQAYQAAPSPFSQLGGLGATALGAYGAAGGFKAAKGGEVKAKRYDVGGAVSADLRNMDDAHLMQEAKSSPSAMVRQEAAEILAERRAAQGIEGAQSNLPTVYAADGGILNFQPENTDDSEHEYAGGGMIAFDKGGIAHFDGTAGSYVSDALKSLGDKFSPPSITDLPRVLGLTKDSTLANILPGIDLIRPATKEEIEKRGKPQANLDKKDTAAPAASPAVSPTTPPVVPPVASSGADNQGITAAGKYDTQIQKLIDELNSGLKSGKSQEDLDALREEIKDKQGQKFWQALMMGGAKAMAGKSQYALSNIGEGIAGGVEDYAKSEAAERADKKLLIAQQSALEQAEYAKKTGNLGALVAAQTRLDNVKLQTMALSLQRQGITDAKQQNAILGAAKLYLTGNAVPTEDQIEAALDKAKAYVTGKSSGPTLQQQAADILKNRQPKG